MKKIIIAIAAIVSLASCGNQQTEQMVIDRYSCSAAVHSPAGKFISRDTVALLRGMHVGDTARYYRTGVGNVGCVMAVRVK